MPQNDGTYSNAIKQAKPRSRSQRRPGGTRTTTWSLFGGRRVTKSERCQPNDPTRCRPISPHSNPHRIGRVLPSSAASTIVTAEWAALGLFTIDPRLIRSSPLTPPCFADPLAKQVMTEMVARSRDSRSIDNLDGIANCLSLAPNEAGTALRNLRFAVMVADVEQASQVFRNVIFDTVKRFEANQ